MESDRVKIMVVDDSRVTRDLIKHLLSINPHVEIIGTAENGVEALDFIKRLQPDVVLTDIVMPEMNGIELTKKIMEINPIPVIVMSGVYSADEIRRSFDGIDAGAIAIMEEPRGIADEQFADTAKFIFDTARLLSSIRGFSKSAAKADADEGVKRFSGAVQDRIKLKQDARGQIKAIAIGSSVGGPKALQGLLSPLPTTIKAPVFIVQHISPGFVQGFADWLNDSIALTVKIPANNEEALPGHVYIAPDKCNMEVDEKGRIRLREESSQEIYVPSIGKLFQSVANSYGPNALGVLLLGAEKDGLKALTQMKEKGGFTIVESSGSVKKEIRPHDSADVNSSIEEISNILKEIVITK